MHEILTYSNMCTRSILASFEIKYTISLQYILILFFSYSAKQFCYNLNAYYNKLGRKLEQMCKQIKIW
jgi:hypothetical protein